jgi:hypothetical protein
MPNIPSTGASGEIDFNGDIKSSHGRPSPRAGSQEHGPNSPSHGAAGGYDIPLDTHGAAPQVRPEKNIDIGLTTNDPEFGR